MAASSARQLTFAQAPTACADGFRNEGYRRLRRVAGVGRGQQESVACSLAGPAPAARAAASCGCRSCGVDRAEAGPEPTAAAAAAATAAGCGGRACAGSRAAGAESARPNSTSAPGDSGSAGSQLAAAAATAAAPAADVVMGGGPAQCDSEGLAEALSLGCESRLPRGLHEAALARRAGLVVTAARRAAAAAASACSDWRCRRASMRSLRRMARDAVPTASTEAHTIAVLSCRDSGGSKRVGRVREQDGQVVSANEYQAHMGDRKAAAPSQACSPHEGQAGPKQAPPGCASHRRRWSLQLPQLQRCAADRLPQALPQGAVKQTAAGRCTLTEVAWHSGFHPPVHHAACAGQL